ncbi:MFS transporter [Halobacteriales archaeon SW_8_65_20]|nr:MAG: MFS transporter [Halobacteriales archaeon SW_8_65_20]
MTADNQTRSTGIEPLMFVGGLWFVAKLARYSFPALFPTLETSLSVSSSQLGVAYTAMMLLYSLVQFPSGALADALEDVRVIAVGGATAAVGAIGLLLSPSYPVLVVGMLLVGLGTGVHKTVSIGLLARLYPSRTGRALGVFDTLGTVGGIVAPPAVVFALASIGWQVLLAVVGVVGITLTAGLLARVPRADRDDSTVSIHRLREQLAVRPYLGPFRDRGFLLFVAVTLCFSFAYNGVVAFLPSYLVERGLTDSTAAFLYSGLFAVSVVQVVTGSLSDRLGRLPLVAAVLAIATLSLAGLVVADGTALALGVATVGLGIGSHGFRPVRAAYLSNVIPDEIAGGGLGLVRTLLMGVGATAPAIVGLVADSASFRVAFAGLAIVMGGAIVFTALSVLADTAA